MTDYMLHLTQEDNIVLGAGIVNRLIACGNGDAALLYLCLARHGACGPEQLCAMLKWDETRFSSAAQALRAMGLVSAPLPDDGAAAKPAAAKQRQDAVAPETAMPDYSREDVMDKLESDASFAALLAEVERQLGKLGTPSLQKLLGLYDYLGLPANVIYLLVNWCVERHNAQFGNSRPPTMREIEKEGYVWARHELFSYAAADAYVKNEKKKRTRYPAYMAVLQLGDRAIAPGEERYLAAWLSWGFPPETVAIAYDKTIVRCHEFKWPYCNGILKRWHEKGLHTPEEVGAENAPQRRGAAQQKNGAAYDKNAWMDEFIK